jgi:peptidoglycan/LPS O-acetylase OafA/YrhL
MTQALPTTILEKFFPVYEHRSLSVLTDIPVAILFATAMYYLVEEPCRKKMRTMIR